MEDRIEEITNQKIKGKKINEQPLCILVGGLPGSGKTNLVKKIQEEYPEREFVIIDTDDYRKLHPNYEKLLETPEKAIIETSQFSNEIEARLIKKAIKQRCDIISVTTLRATQAIQEMLYEPAMQSGYQVEVYLMSVPIRESGLSAEQRYEKQIIAGECPRFTSMNFIESSMQGIINTIQMFQQKEEKPIMKVYHRGENENAMPIQYYDSEKNGNRYNCTLEAFMNPIHKVTEEEAKKQIEALYQRKKQRLANEIEYSSIERLEEFFDIKTERNRD